MDFYLRASPSVGPERQFLIQFISELRLRRAQTGSFQRTWYLEPHLRRAQGGRFQYSYIAEPRLRRA